MAAGGEWQVSYHVAVRSFCVREYVPLRTEM